MFKFGATNTQIFWASY